jgi:hypothetical protein
MKPPIRGWPSWLVWIEEQAACSQRWEMKEGMKVHGSAGHNKLDMLSGARQIYARFSNSNRLDR